jgi:hypothetical protein
VLRQTVSAPVFPHSSVVLPRYLQMQNQQHAIAITFGKNFLHAV